MSGSLYINNKNRNKRLKFSLLSYYICKHKWNHGSESLWLVLKGHTGVISASEGPKRTLGPFGSAARQGADSQLSRLCSELVPSLTSTVSGWVLTALSWSQMHFLNHSRKVFLFHLDLSERQWGFFISGHPRQGSKLRNIPRQIHPSLLLPPGGTGKTDPIL